MRLALHPAQTINQHFLKKIAEWREELVMIPGLSEKIILDDRILR